MKIACLTPINHIPNVFANLSSLGEIIYHPDADYQTACESAKIADILFVNPNKMKYRLDRYLLENSSVKYVVTASTGTNHIDLETAKNKNIEVISLMTAHSIIGQISSTAEHAFALTLALVRNIPKAMANVQAWDYEPYIGQQLQGKTFGIIGYGRLGKMYANYARAFGGNVMYYDIKGDCDTLEDIQENANIISLHVHLNPTSWHLVSFDFVSKLKKKPYLINTARGDVVNDQAVLFALQNKLISGYATDVLSNELGRIEDSPIIQSMNKFNIIVTPHIGGMTIEAQTIAYNGVIDLLKQKLLYMYLGAL